MVGAAGYSRPGRPSAAAGQADFGADTPRKRTRYHAVDLEDDRSPAEDDTIRLTANRAARPRSVRSHHSSIIPTSSRVPRVPPSGTPRFDSAAAAAAAATGQVDGYKPREERSWEEFHPDLDIDGSLTVFTADQVDGIARNAAQGDSFAAASPGKASPSSAIPDVGMGNSPIPYHDLAPSTPPKRRPGRPPRRPESMLNGLGSPPAPRIVPLPAQNPRERLNLPKPSFRTVQTFASFEEERENQVNYVDRGMANVGFQESEMYIRTEKSFVRLMQDSRDEDRDLGVPLEADGASATKVSAPAVTRVEYDMDEQDERWLEAHNLLRKDEQVEAIRPAIFEITMTQIEKEWHALEKRIPKPNPKPPQTHRPRSSSAAAVNGEPAGVGEEQDSKCAICDEGDCENTNAIVFCDGCDLAVHQECYGIPFIPEGQWLCRKCQMIGRSTPACLFCPNTEGAFKMTHEQRWAHLLCAIFIKEVSLGNTTFMEPIMDVASIPRSRWTLSCYICNQPMGASIQCHHGSCYQAFHVTCARRAKLYLQMKVPGGSLALDAGSQVAYCHKHVPASWRKEHDVDRAIRSTQEYYRRTMRGRRWANSQQSALALLPSNINPPGDPVDDAAPAEDSQNAAAARKKQQQAQKNIWRLPSGAPIVPQVVFDAVEMALQRFALRRRKEFVAEACKYWSLKREARRGAALLKRLQLQLETFSASEITRRDFTAMGAAGRPRLQRRIDMADQLLKQMDTIQDLCKAVTRREQLKLEDAETLKEVLDTIYFPVEPLLEPMIEKAQSHDSRGVFSDGISKVAAKMEARAYTSVATFSFELARAFRAVPGLETTSGLLDAHQRLVNSPVRDENLNSEQKELKKLAKRIIKAMQGPLHDAFRKEAELSGRPYEKEMLELDKTVDESLLRDESMQDMAALDEIDELAGGMERSNTVTQTKVELPSSPEDSGAESKAKATKLHETPSPKVTPNSKRKEPDDGFDDALQTHDTLPTPAPSDHGTLAALTQGGIPWYLETFDPVGTEIHDERWTGREVLRGMSEELSEIDDDELDGMGPEVKGAESARAGDRALGEKMTSANQAKKSPIKRKRRSRGFK